MACAAQNQFAQKSKPLTGHQSDEQVDSGNVAARAVETADDAKTDGIAAKCEDDGNCRGRRRGREQRRVLRRTRSAAMAGRRSYWPSAQRYSIATLRPST